MNLLRANIDLEIELAVTFRLYAAYAYNTADVLGFLIFCIFRSVLAY